MQGFFNGDFNWQSVTHMYKPNPEHEYDAIVIGGGIAGAAIVRALKNTSISNFLVIDEGAHPATGTSNHFAALCHPYIGRGASRLQRLTHLAFDEARVVWAKSWHQGGVFHLAKKGSPFDKEKLSEHLLSLGFNSGSAIALDKDQSAPIIGIRSAGTWFPEGGWVNLKKACEEELGHLQAHQVLWNTRISAIENIAKRWTVFDEKKQLLAKSKRIFFASSVGTKALVKTIGIDLPLKPVRGQLSTFQFSQEMPWAKNLPKVALSGKAYCLPPTTLSGKLYEWQVGSTYDEEVDDLNPWEASHDENREQLSEMLDVDVPEKDLMPTDAFVGIRCVAKDRLPMMGPVPGYPGIYILTALGSRGVMWSALASQMFTEHLACEMHQSAFLDARFFAGARLTAAGLTADLAGALSPARFFAGASNSKPIFPSGCLAK